MPDAARAPVSGAVASPAPEAVYASRVALFGSRLARAERVSRLISSVRLVAFLLAALFVAAWVQAPAARAWLWAAAASGCGFAALLFIHERVIRRQQREAALRQVNEEALARLRHAWNATALPEAPPDWREDLVARDLGVFGRASLFQLLGTVTTPPGRATLARWLLAPAAPEEIRTRQDAVRALREQVDFRQEWQALGQTAPELGPFLAWAEDAPWLSRTLRLAQVAPVLALATPASLVAAALGWLPLALPFALGLCNGILSLLVVGRIHAGYARIAARKGQLGCYAAMLRLAGTRDRDWNGPKLRALKEALETGGLSAAHQFDRLDSLLALSELRFVPFFYLPLQVVCLWDVLLFLRFEHWQRKAGPCVRRWVEALGEIEALNALAALSFENPGWSFAELVPAGTGETLSARDLGHPLIAPEARVVNDVRLGAPATYLLLTGSNMSGKSTLLRAIGLNVSLAQAGGPACASALRLAPVCLGTSIVVEDSLANGVSFFLAELRRLKAIVDLARESDRDHGRMLLFLLDEILRGTNSVERRLAVREVLLHLLARSAFGIVSTHDLSLVDIPELRSAARIFHFRETIGGSGDGDEIMSFDYKLRPGVATTTNAMRLLDLVGLRFGTPSQPAS